MYKRIKGYYPEILDYFPEFIKPRVSSSKEVYVDVFKIRDSSMANKFISYSLKDRNRK